MSFGRHALGQGQFHGRQHRLLVMVQHQRQDVDHLAIAAETPQHQRLQLPEAVGHLAEGRAVAQGAGLALDDGQIVPPVVDGAARQMVGPLDEPPMLAQDLALGRVTPKACLRRDDEPVGIDAQSSAPGFAETSLKPY